MTTLQSTSYEIFPDCPSFGFTVEPHYNVNMVAREGGYEKTDRRWSRPLSMYTTVPVGPRDDSDIQTLLHFWHAIGGRFTTFRFKDYADYKSCPTWGSPDPADQPLVPVEDPSNPGTFSYQLVKNYTAGATTQQREITQPDGDTIEIANDSAEFQDPSTWLLDVSTGLLTTKDGFSGTPTTWGGEFFVPVRFDSEFPVQIIDRKIHSVSFSLMEKRIPLSKVGPTDVAPGITWDIRDPADLAILTGIAADHGTIVVSRFVEIDVDTFLQSLYRSTDAGVSVTQVSTIGSLGSPAYGNGVWIAGDYTTFGSIQRSVDDGVTWSEVVVGSVGLIGGVVTDGAGNWVVFGSNNPQLGGGSNYATSSDNGVTWTVQSTTTVGGWINYPIYDGSLYITTGSISGFGYIFTSADGITWTPTLITGLDPGSGSITNIGLVNGLYIGGMRFTDEVRIASSAIGLATSANIHTGILNYINTSDEVSVVGNGGSIMFVFGVNGGGASSVDNGVTWLADDMRGIFGGPSCYDTTTNTYISAFSVQLATYTPP